MDKRLKEKFAKWCSDYTQGVYNTTLTDDLDSLIGCMIEYMVKGNPINHYYDFNSLYTADLSDTRKSIGIDLALVKGKCWDNHVVRIHPSDTINPESANLNAIYNISSHNYTKKYAGSTVLTMWSYYNLPLPKTDEGKLILLCIDGFYIGCKSESFHQRQKEYLRLLGFEDLINLLNFYEINNFKDIIKKYDMRGKFKISESGYISTDIPIDEISKLIDLPITLPTQSFKKTIQLQSHKQNIHYCKSVNKLSNPVSFALTGQQDFKYTSLRGK